MKLLFENWRQYLKENENTIYYWQTRGLWKENAIDFGRTHVPKARPRQTPVEDIFEKVRKEKYPDRPSRLDCVFLCDNLEGFAGGSFCSNKKEDIFGEPIETYEVELRGNYKILKTNSEFWTEAVIGYRRNEREDDAEGWAQSYWEGVDSPTLGEILVSPQKQQ